MDTMRQLREVEAAAEALARQAQATVRAARQKIRREQASLDKQRCLEIGRRVVEVLGHDVTPEQVSEALRIWQKYQEEIGITRIGAGDKSAAPGSTV